MHFLETQVVIEFFAIVESSLDPGADGLQKTSDGKWKFLDFIDASQLGDVDCSGA